MSSPHMGKRRLNARFGILAILTVTVVTIVYIRGTLPPSIDRNQIKSSYLIDYPTEFNYKQTLNDCGPFNVAAVVRALKNKEVDSGKFSKEIKWRLPNKYTLPIGLKKQLKQNDIIVKAPNLKRLSDRDKIYFLQEQLSQGKPVIILGEKENYQHYITLLGFDASKDEFYVYDSAYQEDERIRSLTRDDNAALPGNQTITSDKLLDFWGGGGMYGVYNWYAIVASP